MKIALVSKLWEPTTSTSIGGTGAFVGNLADVLVERGHKVSLFATDDSKTKAKLYSVIPHAFDPYSQPLHYLNLENAFKRSKEFDVIHTIDDHHPAFFAPFVKTPTLLTIDYGEVFDHDKKVLLANRKLNYSAISLAIKKMMPSLNWQGVVHHGIPVEKFDYRDKSGKHLLFLGRVSPQKGPDIAIRVARKLNLPLVIAGKMVDIDKDYLDKKVKPFIDGKKVRYVGVADFKKKISLLRNSIALLHPIDYLEAFGLTLIEAMACGTPVVAFNKGAVGEVIKNNKTGFVVRDERGMIKALGRIDKIDRASCRKYAEKYFTIEKMVEGYEKLYKKIK